jgi:ADP-ribose pyrophosphatase YjhB (NUDIX family)/predicted transcriptional regulator
MGDLHKIQMLILRELLFNPKSRFTDLNIQGLTTDHFSYHINKLIEEGLVEKDNSRYLLTVKGKEFANRMDTDNASIEKQPKLAVMVVATKFENGNKYLLVQNRTKEPYFGYSGFITGKIRFGEKILQAANRELKEESGLIGEDMHVKGFVHDHVVLEDTGELVEDKIFYVIHVVNPNGKLLNTTNGINQWITEEDFYNLEKKYYNEDEIYKISQKKEDMKFVESTYLIEEF